MPKRQSSRSLETEVTTQVEPRPLDADEVQESPLFGVAMLKIAMELKKPDAQGLDSILTGVLSKMRLDEGEFRAFLEKNGGLLRAIAQRKGY